MKTNPLVAVAAAVAALMFIVIAVLFSRQSDLENEIVSLRTTIETGLAAKDTSATSRSATPSFTADPVTVGSPPSADAGDVPARVAELERVANGQADILEELVAEKNRVAEARRRASMRGWGPEQAVGAPDTMRAGDQRTAWAPAVADGGVEWIEAEFENPADLARIVVRQTSNPGGIVKVTAINANGVEVPVWAGVDPSTGQALADTPFPVPAGIHAGRVKVYVDSGKLAGWEEIDAMQIVGRDGTAQWAKSVNASSTYASGGGRRLGIVADGTDLILNDLSGTLRLEAAPAGDHDSVTPP